MPELILTNQPNPPGNTDVILAMFREGIDLLFQHSPSHPNSNCDIRVTYGIGPQVRYGGNNILGFDIDLTSGNDDWCNHLYQFCHELCHVFAQFQPAIHPNQWFEESLCEISSLYCIKKISEMIKEI